ncbi:MAG TPA: hypothetical protein VMU67_09175 [Steroidobacteraceae bacterium]|nr:hypothetical protein [Steroidobacteraceae bacterium]
MTTSARMLIETSIAQLQSLSACLVSELGALGPRRPGESLEARACKEILLSITVLVPKLQAARYVIGEDEQGPLRCRQCEDG